MSKRLRNKKIIIPATLLLALGGVSAWQSAPSIAPKEAVPIHRVLYSEYAPDIHRVVRQASYQPLEMDEVLAGVVPHHLPIAIPLLADFYVSLDQHQSVKTVIIIGPDHVNRGRANITLSRARFETPFGTLEPDLGLVTELLASGLVEEDETPFADEHSIGAQALLLSRIIPEAKIVPLIFRYGTTIAEARVLGEVLSPHLGHGTVLVASLDFSHYLPLEQAQAIDQLSARVLGELDQEATSLVKADSPAALRTFLSALGGFPAIRSEAVRAVNGGELGGDLGFTTGYVTGYWGR